uniref:GP-PDE domain-containing protein n=1 Tax=Odontella aurita TaxID=265563 RepID=A0A7S4JI01_9STRA|mmetsp:Transcript_46803/g.141770  ORF Transcript_46803/g.141770 Transcript_46803/m.141770 type:complete len:948 (+) Transcript_46803:186-3029(+)
MVKFGRHLHYYTHNELRDTALYVVPYNDIKGKCMPGQTVRCAGGAGTDSPDHDRDKSSSPSQQWEEKRWDDGGAASRIETEDGFVRIDASDAPLRASSSSAGSGIVAGRWEKLESDFYFATQRFRTEWRSCLALAADDFEKSTRNFWRGVFGAVIAASERSGVETPRIYQDTIRGCLPDTALRLFLAVSTAGETQDTYEHLKDVHSTALVNSEALRKLVKKFDKDVDKLCAKLSKELGTCSQGGEAKLDGVEEDGDGPINGRAFHLSGELLPEIYSSNFNVGLPTVESGLALVRAHLGLDEEEDDDENDVSSIQAARIRFMSMDQEGMSRARNLADMGGGGDPHSDDDRIIAEQDVAGFFGLTLKRRDSDAILVEKRKMELHWLRKLVTSLAEMDRIDVEKEGLGGAILAGEGAGLSACLVGHRGFHSIKDRSDKRPLENSQMAYEAAWTNGVHLCECDITLTRDDRIILCHDENFTRLALDPDDPRVKRRVRDLTYREIMNLPLKSGVRPPLLFDVLRSAHAIGGEARMIVEIKPGNTEAGTALARMFAKHPQLMERTAVVMSFDAFAMQNLRRELEAVFPTTPRLIPSPPSTARMSARKEPPMDLLHAQPQPPHSHSHRRGFNVVPSTGALPHIPTAMSIGEIQGLAVPAVVAATAGSGHMVAFDEKARTDSVGDQLGMSLESTVGGGMRKGDSFHFSPFKRVGSNHNSIHRDKSGGALSSSFGKSAAGGLLIPPVSPCPAPATIVPAIGRFDDAMASGHQLPGGGGGAGEPQTVAIPKLLLITRCGLAQNEEQRDALKVDVSDPADLNRARTWLQGNSPQERLDGLYLQFQPCMLDSPGSAAACRSLTEHYSVGVWGANPKRDDVETFTRLVKECGVSYVNSGLPKKFFRDMVRRASGNSLAAMFGGAGEGDVNDAMANMEENSKTWAHPGRQRAQPVHLGLPW